ncbi:hypothetical protein VNI00_009349 [Paramarasmius palmivorus]|uniref:Uncharacterized protein n=1 Tax=Paramarasmius palmivorus TaxID=297713 RepID=A0AAW0CSN0_9AGAR
MTTQVLTMNHAPLTTPASIRIPFAGSRASSAAQYTQETPLPLREGIYRIQTQTDDGDELYLSADAGYVKAKAKCDDDSTLWKVVRSRTLSSGVKYTIENVATKEKINVSSSRLLLITTKDADLPPYAPPFEVTFSPSSSGYQISTTLPDDRGFKDEFYFHLGVWQLEPWGKPVLPAPVHISTKVFPEADCVWSMGFVKAVEAPRQDSLRSVSSLESVSED